MRLTMNFGGQSAYYQAYNNFIVKYYSIFTKLRVQEKKYRKIEYVNIFRRIPPHTALATLLLVRHLRLFRYF